MTEEERMSNVSQSLTAAVFHELLHLVLLLIADLNLPSYLVRLLIAVLNILIYLIRVAGLQIFRIFV